MDLRLQIAPFENLSADPSLDWEGRIAPFILTTDLSGLPHVAASMAEPRPTRVLRGYYDVQRGQLAVHATLEDPRGPKTVRVLVREGPLSSGITPLLDQIAQQIHAGAHPFPAPDPAALRSFSDAMGSADAGARARLFQTAALQNPKFSTAYLGLAETRLSQGDREGARQAAVAGKAVSRDPIERAQFDYVAATANNDLSARERAMQELVRLTPNDTQALRTLAEIHSAQRRYREAADDYQRIATLEPDDRVVFNQLGYMAGYAHDIPRARAAFQRYQELVGPADVDPIDSLGEIYFQNGDFAAAEAAFLDAAKKAGLPAGRRELLKAAEARLLTGDISGADSLFDKYEALQPQEIERAQWEFITGRRKQAMSRVEKLTPAPGDAGAMAAAQLSFWRLQTGDRASASQLAAAAYARAATPGVKNLAAVCRFLTITPPGQSPFANINAVALILNHRFAEAVPLLERLVSETTPATDAQVRTLLAWAYVETGKISQAQALVDLYPIPLPSNEPAFVSLVFPRFLQVRATVLKAEQRGDEARRNQELYDKLAGDLPDRF